MLSKGSYYHGLGFLSHHVGLSLFDKTPHHKAVCHAVSSHFHALPLYPSMYIGTVQGHGATRSHLFYLTDNSVKSSEGVGVAVCSPGFLHRHSVGGKLSHVWEVRISFTMTGYQRGCSSLVGYLPRSSSILFLEYFISSLPSLETGIYITQQIH